MLARGTPHVAAGGRAASATSSSVHVLCTPLPARRPTSRGTHQQISPHILNMYLQPFFPKPLSPRLHPVQPQRPLAKGMGLTSAIEKDTVGLSLRLRGGGAPDSKGKGACTQQRRTPA